MMNLNLSLFHPRAANAVLDGAWAVLRVLLWPMVGPGRALADIKNPLRRRALALFAFAFTLLLVLPVLVGAVVVSEFRHNGWLTIRHLPGDAFVTARAEYRHLKRALSWAW